MRGGMRPWVRGLAYPTPPKIIVSSNGFWPRPLTRCPSGVDPDMGGDLIVQISPFPRQGSPIQYSAEGGGGQVPLVLPILPYPFKFPEGAPAFPDFFEFLSDRGPVNLIALAAFLTDLFHLLDKSTRVAVSCSRNFPATAADHNAFISNHSIGDTRRDVQILESVVSHLRSENSSMVPFLKVTLLLA